MADDYKKTKCLNCEEIVIGRSDKKYCNPYCKSEYQYKIKKDNPESTFNKIDKILKNNRKILKNFNKAGKSTIRKETLINAGKSTIRKETLINAGFEPKYFTNYWKAKNGNLYLFCYEFGFMQKTENNKSKYILIKWQEYMNK